MKLHPKKLKLSKWTAVHPVDKEKHFLVTRIIEPGTAASHCDFVELEAVISGRRFLLRWRELSDAKRWLQGWR